MMARVSGKPRLLSISYHVPYLNAPHAGGAFVYRHLMALRRHFQVDTVVPATKYTRLAAQQSSADLPVSVIGRERQTGPLRNTVERIRKVYAGVSPGASVVASVLEDSHFHRLVAHADIVELQWSEMLVLAPYIQQIRPDLPLVCICHDVITQALLRKAAVAPPHRSVFYRLAAHRSRRIEPALLASCRAAYVFSDKDRQLLIGLGAKLPIEVIEPDLTTPQRIAVRPMRPTALFVGAMDRRENFEGVLEFLDAAWPLVRARVPDARLNIVGADPPSFLVSRATEDVIVTGRVDDLDAWYRDASVFVVPLRLGAGLKFKVPQAMLYGLPVVSTSVGAEGVADEAGLDIFACVSDDISTFADGVVQAMSDPDYAETVGQKARRWATSRFDFDASVERMAYDYSRLISASQSRAEAGK
jgi:glycosyltransferase involved in cell wall biosynthesis